MFRQPAVDLVGARRIDGAQRRAHEWKYVADVEIQIAEDMPRIYCMRDEAMRDRIFEPFFTTKPGRQGHPELEAAA